MQIGINVIRFSDHELAIASARSGPQAVPPHLAAIPADPALKAKADSALAGGRAMRVPGAVRRLARLADGAHDLRAVTREMARRMGGSNRHGFINVDWQASFSRAVAGLVSRELIEILWLVRLRDFDDDFPMRRKHLADGHYMVRGSRQRWFVRVPDVSVMTTTITLNRD